MTQWGVISLKNRPKLAENMPVRHRVRSCHRFRDIPLKFTFIMFIVRFKTWCIQEHSARKCHISNKLFICGLLQLFSLIILLTFSIECFLHPWCRILHRTWPQRPSRRLNLKLTNCSTKIGRKRIGQRAKKRGNCGIARKRWLKKTPKRVKKWVWTFLVHLGLSGAERPQPQQVATFNGEKGFPLNSPF